MSVLLLQDKFQYRYLIEENIIPFSTRFPSWGIMPDSTLIFEIEVLSIEWNNGEEGLEGGRREGKGGGGHKLVWSEDWEALWNSLASDLGVETRRFYAFFRPPT